MPDIVYTYMEITYIYMYTVPTIVYNRQKTVQILTSPLLPCSLPHNLGNDPFRTVWCDLLHQYHDHTEHDTYTFNPT